MEESFSIDSLASDSVGSIVGFGMQKMLGSTWILNAYHFFVIENTLFIGTWN